MNTALIVGGNGIIGRNLAEYLGNKSGWNVLVTSLSPLAYKTNVTYISMDLRKEQEIVDNAESLKTVTHVFFTAYTQRSNPYDQVEANMALLTNLMYGMEKVAPKLAHVVFIQGGKAYGAHLGVYKTPAKETDPRSTTPNFYST